MEKKYLSKNAMFGLCWLCGWVPALVLFLTEKDTLELEEKQNLVAVFVAQALMIVINIIPVVGQILSIAIAVLMIVCGIMTILGKGFEIPGVSHIAKAIIK